MVEQLRIRVLVENTAGRRQVLAEHGLAFWIEADGRNILFDTGQGLALAHNAEALGVDLAATQDLVLSHGHYDHTGGLDRVWDQLGRATVYVHPRAFEAKFGRWGENAVHNIGSPIRSIDQVRAHVGEVVSTAGPTKPAEGVWVSGEIPRGNDFEDTGGPFFLDESCREPDPLVDDQAMYLETPGGVVVLLGCAHAGLVNTLDYVGEVTRLSRVHAVLGGMHLVNASEERISRSVAALRDYDVQVVGPAHCTGLKATAAMLGGFRRSVRDPAGRGGSVLPDSG